MRSVDNDDAVGDGHEPQYCLKGVPGQMFSGVSPQNVVNLGHGVGGRLNTKMVGYIIKKKRRTPGRWFATPSFPLVRVDFPKLTTEGIVVGMMFDLQPEMHV